MSRQFFRSLSGACLAVVLSLGLAACQTTGAGVENAAGKKTTYQDSSKTGPVSGVGIEGQDIIAMSDQMMRDMLLTPQLGNAAVPPRVIIDAKHFTNESSQRINKNLIADRLRVGLARAAAGRMQFVGREYADVVEQERQLKRDGKVDVATAGLARAQAGSDYRLVGRIASLDSRDGSSGLQQRYTQITFEMIDLESGLLVWTNIYDFTKAAADSVVYR